MDSAFRMSESESAREDIRTAREVLKAKLGRPVELECPECNDPGPHDVNDDRRDPTFLCMNCGRQTDVSYFEPIR